MFWEVHIYFWAGGGGGGEANSVRKGQIFLDDTDTLLECTKTKNKNNQILQNVPFIIKHLSKKENITYFLKYT